MSEQDEKIVNLGRLKKFKEYYDTDITTPINNKINSKTNVQSGETITTNNDTIGYFKDIKINGNTRYKKSDGTYTDTWEDGVSLESLGEKEKNADGKYPIEVVSIDNAKNLIKSDNILDGYYYDNNNTLQPNSSFQTLKKAISVQSNKTYYVVNSSNTKTNVTYVLYYATDGSVIKCEYDKNIITIPSNCTSIRFSAGGLKNLCFSLSENYSVYTFDKRTILLDSPLRKNDVLDLEKLKITRNYGSATFNGSDSENWELGVSHINSIVFYKESNDSQKYTQSTPSSLSCDKLIYNWNIWSNDEEGTRIDNHGAFQISILKSKLETQDVAGFKKWLQSNPVTVVYQLATPITEDIDVSSNTLTDFATSCTLTVDNTIKGNIECNEVVGLIPSVEEDRTRLANVEKSLENKAEKNHTHDSVYVKQDGSTPIIERVQMPRGSYAHEAVGAGISGNWMLIAEINIKSDNINQPLEFNITGRNRQTSVTLWILFEATDGTDPALISFKYNNTKGYQAYLVKKATSTWSLYINKSEPYDFLDIIDVHIPKYTSTVVTYKSTTVSTLPEGGTYASPVQHAISEITNLQTTLDGKASSTHNHDTVYSKLGHTHNYAGSSSAGGSATSAITSNFTGYTWTTPTKVGTWSALCKFTNYSTGIFSLILDQNSQCGFDTFMIGTGWDNARIYQLGGNGYGDNSGYQLRLVKESDTQYTLEVKNNYGYNGATTLDVKCRYIITNNKSGVDPSLLRYTTFCPSSGKTEKVKITTSPYNMVGTISNAIKDSEGNIIKDTYVKKSGGTLTGDITLNENKIITNTRTFFKKANVDTHYAVVETSSVDNEAIFGDQTKGSSTLNSYIRVGPNKLQYQNGSTTNNIYHSGNFNPSNYLSLSGGTMTGNITLPKGKTISTTTSGGNTLLEETDSNVNIGFATKGVNLNCSAGYVNGSMILTKGNSNYAEVLFMGTTGGTTRKNVNSCMKITTYSDNYYPVFTAPSDGVYLFMAWGSVSNILAVNKQQLCSSNQYSGVKPLYLAKSDEASFYLWFSGNANSGLSSGIDIVVMRIN